MRHVAHALLPALILAAGVTGYAQPGIAEAQSSASSEINLPVISPRSRVLQAVNDNDRVPLPGNTLPQALSVYDTGALEPGHRLDHMLLTLQPSAAQQQALDKLAVDQQDRHSPLYHQWLTPESYAARFGVSNNDLEQVQGWLARYGLEVDEVLPNHRALVFSGTTAQLEAALQTTMHTYQIAGHRHIANSADPMIPAALAPVVQGVASLHDFFSEAQHTSVKTVPQLTSGTAHYLSPADFATIYNLMSLYRQAYTGDGQTIAIAGRSELNLADVRKFRSQFGLTAKDPVVVNTGRPPGSTATADFEESMLDVEWAGAVANRATVEYVTSASSAVTDGVFLSAQYIVNHNLAPIVSVSYGLCETALGSAGNGFFQALWQQAAVQGMTVLVASGDSGAAGCDPASALRATQGRGVNGICSTPYSTCVGGTSFNEGGNGSQYWASTNGSAAGSALGYIPELAWNESGSGGLWSTAGGVSNTYAKPSWQAGAGVPADGRRDVPDLALTAAAHDGYLVQLKGSFYAFSGTSASSPALAGIFAIIAQKTASRLGNVDATLYKLSNAQRSASGAAVFHDIAGGNNTVPGVTGFPADPGYDQATGLGSVDAEKLFLAWSTASLPAPGFTLTLSPATISFHPAASTTITLITTSANGFQSPITLSVSGFPTGLTAAFTPHTIATAGGVSLLKLTASPTLPPGSWILSVTAGGGGVVRTTSLPIVITRPAGTSIHRSPRRWPSEMQSPREQSLLAQPN